MKKLRTNLFTYTFLGLICLTKTYANGVAKESIDPKDCNDNCECVLDQQIFPLQEELATNCAAAYVDLNELDSGFIKECLKRAQAECKTSAQLDHCPQIQHLLESEKLKAQQEASAPMLSGGNATEQPDGGGNGDNGAGAAQAALQSAEQRAQKAEQAIEKAESKTEQLKNKILNSKIKKKAQITKILSKHFDNMQSIAEGIAKVQNQIDNDKLQFEKTEIESFSKCNQKATAAADAIRLRPIGGQNSMIVARHKNAVLSSQRSNIRAKTFSDCFNNSSPQKKIAAKTLFNSTINNQRKLALLQRNKRKFEKQFSAFKSQFTGEAREILDASQKQIKDNFDIRLKETSKLNNARLSAAAAQSRMNAAQAANGKEQNQNDQQQREEQEHQEKLSKAQAKADALDKRIEQGKIDGNLKTSLRQSIVSLKLRLDNIMQTSCSKQCVPQKKQCKQGKKTCNNYGLLSVILKVTCNGENIEDGTHKEVNRSTVESVD